MYLHCSGRRAAVPVPLVRAGGPYLRAPSTRGTGASLYLYLRYALECSFDMLIAIFCEPSHTLHALDENPSTLKGSGLTNQSRFPPKRLCEAVFQRVLVGFRPIRSWFQQRTSVPSSTEHPRCQSTAVPCSTQHLRCCQAPYTCTYGSLDSPLPGC